MFGARIIGAGMTTEGLELVTNDEIARRLLEKEAAITEWLVSDDATSWWKHEFARGDSEWWRPNIALGLLAKYGKPFEKRYNRACDFANRNDRLLIWNEFMREIIVTNDAWIRENTGIEQRYFAKKGVATSDLAIEAARKALKSANVSPDQIDGLFLATVSPDHNQTPPTTAIIADALGLGGDAGGLRNFDYLDGSQACSSSIMAIRRGYHAIATGSCDCVLVGGADTMSTTDSHFSRNILPILGDGSGFIVLKSGPVADSAFRPPNFFSTLIGRLKHLIITPAGGSRLATSPSMIQNPFDQSNLMFMNGPEVRRKVIRLLVPSKFSEWANTLIPSAFTHAGYEMENESDFSNALLSVDLMLFHQANGVILDDLEERLRNYGYRGQFFRNINRHGNTTSASIFLLFIEAWQQGILRPGMKVMAVVFGGGFTAATIIFDWTLENPSED